MKLDKMIYQQKHIKRKNGNIEFSAKDLTMEKRPKTKANGEKSIRQYKTILVIPE